MSTRAANLTTKGKRTSRASEGRLSLVGWSTLALIGVCAAAACGSAVDVTPSGSGYTSATVPTANTTTSSSGGSGGGGAVGDGLPCDIAAILVNCVACHSNPPVANAPSSLQSYADLTASSISDPSKTEAQMALARMQDAAKPMPPAPATLVPAADIATFQAWVTAGTPQGSCGGGADAGVNHLNDPPTCTSGTYWDQQSANSYMAPGDACIACHSQGEGPSYSVAGTVYATGHEKQYCNAQALPNDPPITTAIVEITGADMTVIALTVDSVGNFYRRTSKTPALVKPYTVKVTYNGKERVMVTPQNDGDCNKCHTQNGAGNPKAPGRVTLP